METCMHSPFPLFKDAWNIPLLEMQITDPDENSEVALSIFPCLDYRVYAAHQVCVYSD